MTITENEMRLMMGIMHELLCMPYEKLNTIYGNITIERMGELYHKINAELENYNLECEFKEEM